jgi:ATP-dependent helicase/nuclease subunit B
MTLKFLEAEKDFVMNSHETLTIERLESRFDTSFTIEIENEIRTIKIGGYVDRVDKVGNRYRVIDYKSGKVTKENVTIGRKKGSEKLNFKKTKHALQLAFYALMFEEKYGILPDEVLIISLIDAKGKYPLCGKENQSINEISEQVKEFVQEIYSEMIDSTIDFTHNKSAFYCQYCK